MGFLWKTQIGVRPSMSSGEKRSKNSSSSSFIPGWRNYHCGDKVVLTTSWSMEISCPKCKYPFWNSISNSVQNLQLTRHCGYFQWVDEEVANESVIDSYSSWLKYPHFYDINYELWINTNKVQVYVWINNLINDSFNMFLSYKSYRIVYGVKLSTNSI